MPGIFILIRNTSWNSRLPYDSKAYVLPVCKFHITLTIFTFPFTRSKHPSLLELIFSVQNRRIDTPWYKLFPEKAVLLLFIFDMGWCADQLIVMKLFVPYGSTCWTFDSVKKCITTCNSGCFGKSLTETQKVVGFAMKIKTPERTMVSAFHMDLPWAYKMWGFFFVFVGSFLCYFVNSSNKLQMLK